HRAGVPHDVALGRLDLDHVGAVVGEDLRRVGAHQYGRHVDDAHAGERAAWRRRGAHAPVAALFPALGSLGHRGPRSAPFLLFGRHESNDREWAPRGGGSEPEWSRKRRYASPGTSAIRTGWFTS